MHLMSFSAQSIFAALRFNSRGLETDTLVSSPAASMRIGVHGDNKTRGYSKLGFQYVRLALEKEWRPWSPKTTGASSGSPNDAP